MTTQRTALLTASDKTDLPPFAARLSDLGWRILASTGTKAHLDGFGITCRDVADIVGPPILGHRVVTLSREIFASILAQDTPADNEELQRLGLSRIDLVCVDLYPLGKAIEDMKDGFDVIRNTTDIGGPSLLRAAAKGGRIVVSRKDDFEVALELAEDLARQNDMKSPERQKKLAALAWAAEMTVMEYCRISMEAYAKFYKLDMSTI